jgi:N-acetylglucosaminyl-diphospho-decaprenol L-rhamnosyltransferase
VDGLSIITVGYESATKLPGFLAAAAHAAPNAERIVVDNASRDQTARVARRHGAEQVLASAENVGFGRACNLGARAAAGEWLLFANPDIELERVPSHLRRDARAYGLGAGVVAEDGGVHRPAVRAEATVVEDVFAQLLTRFLPREVSRWAPKRRHPARWASGAVLLCRKSEFLSLGGFDERFFMYFEDRDLGRRYRDCGYRLRAELDLRASHGHGASSPSVASWIRELWSLTSWIEYRGIWHGPDAASAAASLALRTLGAMQATIVRAPLGRTRRKRESVRMILRGLGEIERRLPSGAGFYPNACAALSAAADDARAGMSRGTLR